MFLSRLALITLMISALFMLFACSKKSQDEISSDEIMQSVDSVKKMEAVAPANTAAAPSANKKAATINDETVSKSDYSPEFSESGNLVVQLQVYNSKKMAQRLANQLAEKGYHAYVAEVENPTDQLPGTFYRVRVGNFSTLSKAKDFGDNVLAVMGYQYWVDNKNNDNVGKGGGSSYYAPATTPAYSAPEPAPAYTAPAPEPAPAYTAPEPAPAAPAAPVAPAPAPAPVPAGGSAPGTAPAGGDQNFDF